MNSPTDRVPETTPDYYARGLALWPRLSHPRASRVRDPHRLATLISRRTNLPQQAILELLGVTTDPE